MDEIKVINKKFLIHLLLYIGIILILIGIAIFSHFKVKNENLVYLIWFGLLVIGLIVSGIFRNRLDIITNYSYIIKIGANASDPIRLRSSVDIEENLLNVGYQLKYNKKAYKLYYRVVKDDIKRIFKRHMLEVVILSKVNKFFIEEADADIDTLHKELHKQRIKSDKLFVTQIREFNELNNEVKDQIKEIAFVKSARGIISIINIGIHKPSKTAVMLYTDKYRPSLYYEYHVNLIKDILK